MCVRTVLRERSSGIVQPSEPMVTSAKWAGPVWRLNKYGEGNMNRVLWLGLALTLGAGVCEQSFAAERKPSVLFVITREEGFGRGMDYKSARAYHEAGFEISQCTPSEVTWDRLRRHHVAVLIGMGVTKSDYKLLPYMARNESLYGRFLKEGGGIFFNPFNGESATPMPAIWSFSDQYGFRPLLEEIHDPANLRRATGWNVPFSYTDQIESHPVTAGVRGVWYPILRGQLYPRTMPLALEAPWTAVLFTAETAYTVPFQTFTPQIDARARKEGSRGKVPIAAVREFPGAGRMVVFGLYPAFSFADPFAEALEGISINKGMEGKRSDLFTFLCNSLRWLAEPSVKSGSLGGAGTDPKLLKNPHVLDKKKWGRTIGWTGAEELVIEDCSHPPAGSKWKRPATVYRGLIGARTRYSGGKGGPAEWSAAGARNGFAFVALMEDLAKLTPDGWAQLKKECLATAEAPCQVIPGFFVTDIYGGHWFFLGDLVPYPDARFLDAEKRFGVDLVGKEAGFHGLGTVILNYVIVQARMNSVAGSFLHKLASYPAYDFRDYCAAALVTQTGTNQDEEILNDYLYMQHRGESLLPVAVTMIDDPGAMDRVKSANYHTYVLARSPRELRQQFNKWHMLYNEHFFVSNGPIIEDYSHIGDRDYSQIADWYNYSDWRWKVRLIASSPAGIEKVDIYDGPDVLFRRFLCGGKAQVALYLDMVHDRQKNLVAIVTDRQGHRAISGEQYDRSHLNQEFMCSDRNNQLTSSMQPRGDGTYFKTGFGCGVTPNKGPWNGEISAGVFRWDWKLGGVIQGFDGAPAGQPAAYFTPHTNAKEGKGKDLHGRPRRLLFSSDIMIGECETDGTFPADIEFGNVWHCLGPVAPLDDLYVHRRILVPIVKPDGMSAIYQEFEITTKKELHPDGNAIFLNLGMFDRQKCQSYAFRRADGSVLCGRIDRTRPDRGREESFGVGSYLALYDSPMGGAALYSLTDGLKIRFGVPWLDRAMFGWVVPGDVVPAGTRFTARLLLVGIDRAQEPTNELVEAFRTGLGVGCHPSYLVDVESGHRVDDHYWLRIDGGGKGFAGTIKRYPLPANLPIVVENLNTRWSAGYYDRNAAKYRPIGVAEGKAYAVTDPSKGDCRIFVGHPVTCDNSDVFITVVQTDRKSFLVDFHNPTDRPITVAAEVCPFLDLVERKAFDVKIPAGSSVRESLQ